MTEILVLGIGNVLMSDEGVGPRAARDLEPRVPDGVRVIESGGLGIDLLHDVEEAGRLLVLDCVEAGVEPGRVVRLDGRSLAAGPGPHLSPHEFGVGDVLGLARLHGREPEEVVVLGIQPARIAPGTELSAEVDAALPGLVAEALGVLEAWIAPGRSA